MGRELKRVPMDFDWPMNQIWKGFVNPYRSQKCKACDGVGFNPATKQLSDNWYGHSCSEQDWVYITPNRRYNRKAWSHNITQDEVNVLVKEGRLMDLTHVFTSDKGWQPKDPSYHPTAEEVNKWSLEGMGHDSCNHFICVKTRAKRLGVYGLCKYCKGDGEIWQSDEIKKLAEKWNPFDPPKGKGFQLWETTSEGSPITPVFASLDELCVWAAINSTTFADCKATAEEWKKMLDHDFVCHKEGNAVFL